MSDYSQPEFYRFSEDSIILAKKAIELMSDIIVDQFKICDIGAGCGVVGLEILKSFPLVDIHLEAVELQKEFAEHFYRNAEGISKNITFINSDIGCCNLENQYDLIVSNPPYFSVKKSRSCGDPKRDICRRFPSSWWPSFFKFTDRYLKNNGLIIFSSREAPPKTSDYAIEELENHSGMKLFRVVKLNKNIG